MHRLANEAEEKRLDERRATAQRAVEREARKKASEKWLEKEATVLAKQKE